MGCRCTQPISYQIHTPALLEPVSVYAISTGWHTVLAHRPNRMSKQDVVPGARLGASPGHQVSRALTGCADRYTHMIYARCIHCVYRRQEHPLSEDSAETQAAPPPIQMPKVGHAEYIPVRKTPYCNVLATALRNALRNASSDAGLGWVFARTELVGGAGDDQRAAHLAGHVVEGDEHCAAQSTAHTLNAPHRPGLPKDKQGAQSNMRSLLKFIGAGVSDECGGIA